MDSELRIYQTELEVMRNHAVVLYDGVCNLCTWWVQFIIKRDHKGYFKFGALQSDAGRKFLENQRLRPEATDTVILIEGYRYFTKSDAALRIAARLSGFWPILRVFSLIPRSIRNWCYDIIARNRYKWFGRANTCMLPSRENLLRFIR
ncbi:MAG: DCC1-like thiol-disulfide oxidoreductase family protein [Syntrophobacteria bacterium]